MTIMKSKLFLILLLSILLLALPGTGQGEDELKLKIIFERKSGVVIGEWKEFYTWEKVLQQGSYEDKSNTDAGLATIKTELTGKELNVKIALGGYLEVSVWKVDIEEGEELPEKTLFRDTVKVRGELTAVGGGGMFAIQNPLKADTFQELIENLIDFVFVIAVAVAPLMILVAGFLFLTAGGAPDKIGRAKQMILWTVIGFAVVMLAKGLIAVLEQILGG